MNSLEKNTEKKEQRGLATTMMAGFCHRCGICPYANRQPDSNFGRLMEWHRTWCPAWAAHTKVYGVKDLH